MQEPTTSTPRRRTLGLAALAGAIGIGAMAIGIAATAAAPSDLAPAARAAAPAVGAEAAWTSPDGATRIRTDELDGRGVRGGLDRSAISITAVDGTKLSLTTDNGWTRTIEAAGATVTKDGAAVEVSTLKVGDGIVFRETRNDDGTYTITAIDVIQPSAAGTVASVSGTTITLTLRDGTTQKVEVTSSTTYQLAGQDATKDAVVAGARIVARGALDSDGTLTATSVQIAPAAAAGTVAEKGADSITLTQRDGTTVVVKVTSSTTYRVGGITSPTLADVKVGDVVTAGGTRDADGSLTATVVQSRAAGELGGPGMGGQGRGGPRMGGDGFGRMPGKGDGVGPSVPGASPAPSTAPAGSGTSG